MSKNIAINEQYHRVMKLESLLTEKPITTIIDKILDDHYTTKRVEEIHAKLR